MLGAHAHAPSTQCPCPQLLGHGVASAIADMQTRKAMVDAVQMECSKAPRNGPQGLQSVSL